MQFRYLYSLYSALFRLFRCIEPAVFSLHYTQRRATRWIKDRGFIFSRGHATLHYVCQSAQKSQICTRPGKTIYPMQEAFKRAIAQFQNQSETIFKVTLKLP